MTNPNIPRDASCEHCIHWNWKPIQGCWCSITRELQDYWDKCERFEGKERYEERR